MNIPRNNILHPKKSDLMYLKPIEVKVNSNLYARLVLRLVPRKDQFNVK